MTSETDIREVLERVHFPASKLELINAAFAQLAPSDVVHALDELPEEEFLSLDAVRETLLRIS